MPEHPPRHAARWISWIFGAAVLAVVIGAALHFSEERELIRLAERAEPAWLLVALVLQVGTYLAEGEVWQRVARAARAAIPRKLTAELALAKLFVDQALPSGGVSGTLVVARSLEQHGMPHRAVTAGVVVDSASYHASYVVCLGVALFLSFVHHEANRLVEFAAAGFALFALGVTTAVLTLSGPAAGALRKKLGRLRPLAAALGFLEDADPRLAKNPSLLAQACGCQLAIFCLDAATVWVLIKASGGSATLPGVFTSFMISTLFRTVGILPGGLGTFEATSVLTLKLIGVELPVALSATLLFRGLSFWLPLAPGLWLSRRAVSRG